MPHTAHVDSGALHLAPQQRPLLVSIGNDGPLLSYRAEVLACSGFQVTSICPAPCRHEDVTALCALHHPAIWIACHTLSREQRILLGQQLRQTCPESRLLALTSGHLEGDEFAGYDILLDSLDGPAALIEALLAQL